MELIGFGNVLGIDLRCHLNNFEVGFSTNFNIAAVHTVKNVLSCNGLSSEFFTWCASAVNNVGLSTLYSAVGDWSLINGLCFSVTDENEFDSEGINIFTWDKFQCGLAGLTVTGKLTGAFTRTTVNTPLDYTASSSCAFKYEIDVKFN